jgi:hypothetical protein
VHGRCGAAACGGDESVKYLSSMKARRASGRHAPNRVARRDVRMPRTF